MPAPSLPIDDVAAMSAKTTPELKPTFGRKVMILELRAKVGLSEELRDQKWTFSFWMSRKSIYD